MIAGEKKKKKPHLKEKTSTKPTTILAKRITENSQLSGF